jgi:hypothetical protein
LLLGTGAALCQQTALRPVTLEGEFLHVVEDHFEQCTASTHYALKTEGGYMELAFPDLRMPEQVKSGSHVA